VLASLKTRFPAANLTSCSRTSVTVWIGAWARLSSSRSKGMHASTADGQAGSSAKAISKGYENFSPCAGCSGGW
jgi:hypothetical protein